MPDMIPADPAAPVIAKTPDLIHTLSNWFSHNRYTAVAILAAVFVVFAASCQVTTASPESGKKATAAELKTELDSKTREDVSALEAAKKARDEEVVKSTRSRDAALAEIAAKYQTSIEEAASRLDIVAAAVANKMQDRQAKYAVAADDIARKQAIVDSVLGWVNQIGGTLSAGAGPLGTSAWALAATLLAGGVIGDNRRKDAIIKANA